jgi:hypothetical protein
MPDVIVGVVAVVAGALFCFRGYLAMRVIIPIWGTFVGFVLGAGLVAGFAGEGFLGSALAWVVGLATALVFGSLSYLYYEVSVLITMSAIGFALGTSLMVALGIRWSWLVVLVGVLVGTLLAVVAIVADVPMALLAVLTAFAGASAMVGGLMLVLGVVSTSDFDPDLTAQRPTDEWWWYALYGGLAVAGVIVQLVSAASLRGSMRESWADAGGRELRTG